jgi:hypothetical protein
MRSSVVLVAALLWLGTACADVGFAAFAGDESSGPEVAGAAVVTPGCDPAAIVEDGAARCATCAFASGKDGGVGDATTICGAPTEAPCETRQNSVGLACQLCITADGEILYDDCFTAETGAPESLSCEVSAGATPDEECRTCFDVDGSAISVGCGPRAESCIDTTVDGRTCQVCSARGVVVSSTCAAADLDPGLCLAYGDDEGRCVDCFDAQGVLLAHECTDALAGDSLLCSQTVQPEGLVCTVCTDAQGTVVERSCESALPQPERCADLVFSEQSCLMCVDADNVVVRVECRRNDCAEAAFVCRADADCPVDFACFDGTCVPASGTSGDRPAPPVECPLPPGCSNEIDDDGDVCRTCPRDDGVLETRCMPISRLACETLPEDQLPAEDSAVRDDAEGAPEEPSQGRLCTLCRDTPSGVEVYRDCEGNGAVPPPFCVDDVDVAGERCSVCFDAVTGEVVYRSCPVDTCADMNTAALVDDNGRRFAFDGPIAHIETATCEQCRQGDSVVTDDVVGGFQPRCIVDSPCTNGRRSDDTSVPCPVTTRLVLAPLSCEQPWDAFGDGADVHDELRDVLEFLLHAGVFAISAEQISAGAPGCDSCTCERGDRIAIEVWSYDDERARALLGDVVVL